MFNSGLNWYLVFVVSWFLHVPARIPALGAIRLDLLLVLVLSVIIVWKKLDDGGTGSRTQTDKLLRILIIYCVLTIPFVEWPGTVIKLGLPNLVKAVVFYYFTVAFIKTERDLKRFIFVFLVCQSIRILEPLYLNFTWGYWGSQASMSGGGEFLSRLSGSPYDVVNPNGLAFVICTVLAFLYFMQGLSWKTRLAFFVLTPLSLYALMLTGSRSGIIGLLVIFIVILVKSKRRMLLLASGILIAIIGFANLSPDMQDRYLSTFGKGEKNIATASDRFGAMEGQLRVAMRRPLFGHGLGTSKEANYHYNDTGPYAGVALMAHNLFLEVAQEIGLIGLIIMILFIKAVFSGFMGFRHDQIQHEGGLFLSKFISAMHAWIVMNFVFSFASYGLSSYDWYLFAGLSVVVHRFGIQITEQHAKSNKPTAGGRLKRIDNPQ